MLYVSKFLSFFLEFIVFFGFSFIFSPHFSKKKLKYFYKLVLVYHSLMYLLLWIGVVWLNPDPDITTISSLSFCLNFPEILQQGYRLRTFSLTFY